MTEQINRSMPGSFLEEREPRYKVRPKWGIRL